MSTPIDGHRAIETDGGPLADTSGDYGPNDAVTAGLDSGRIETATSMDDGYSGGVDETAFSRRPASGEGAADAQSGDDPGEESPVRDIPRRSGATAVSREAVVESTGGAAHDYSAASERGAVLEHGTRRSGRASADTFVDHGHNVRHQTRRNTLERLEHTGFNGRQINELRDIIASSGLPVRGLTGFVHAPDRDLVGANGERGGQVIASMHTHGPDAGRFTVHDCFDQAPPEEKKATVVHEMVHNLSALRPENNEIFGEGEDGEHERLQVATYVSRVVEQSLTTGIHLNGYHKHLMNEYNETKRALDAARNLPRDVQGQHITPEEYEEHLAAARYKLTEETQAILTEMAFFKRADLEMVQARQAQKLDDITRIARQNPDSELLPESVRTHGVDGIPDRVNLITDSRENGRGAQGVGADRIAITLLRGAGVNNYDDLVRHIKNFKGQEWGNRSPRVQQQRARELQDSRR